MPRVEGIMQPLPNVYGTPGRPIESAKYNSQLDDLIADANAARPITAGGTGAASAEAARTALGVPDPATLVKKAGDAMTGALSFTPNAIEALTGGTKAIAYDGGNRRQFELRSGANVFDVTGIPQSGGDLELDLLYTAGTLGFTQTIRWKIGGGAEGASIADTGVVLTAGVRYTVVLWNMGGTLYGVIG